MDVRRSMLVLGLVVLAGGCSTKPAEAPELGIVAIQLHTCLAVEPDGQGPCTDEVLAGCPPDQDREACRQEALDQIDGAESYVPATTDDDGLPPVALVGVAAATVGGLALAGRRAARRNRHRNLAAWTQGARALEARGFAATDRPVPVPATVTAGGRAIRRVTRVRFADGPTPTWVFETDLPGSGMNDTWPARWAIVDLGRPADDLVAPTRLTDLLRARVDDDGPPVLAAVGDHHLLLRTTGPRKRLGRAAPPPLGLEELADLATALVTDILAGTDGR